MSEFASLKDKEKFQRALGLFELLKERATSPLISKRQERVFKGIEEFDMDLILRALPPYSLDAYDKFHIEDLICVEDLSNDTGQRIRVLHENEKGNTDYKIDKITSSIAIDGEIGYRLELDDHLNCDKISIIKYGEESIVHFDVSFCGSLGIDEASFWQWYRNEVNPDTLRVEDLEIDGEPIISMANERFYEQHGRGILGYMSRSGQGDI